MKDWQWFVLFLVGMGAGFFGIGYGIIRLIAQCTL